MKSPSVREVLLGALLVATVSVMPHHAFARDIEATGGEISVYVTPGEPTQVKFPGDVAGGVKRKLSALSLDSRATDLVIFAGDAIAEQGEAVIVRLKDGRSYSLRVQRAADAKQRDAVVTVEDSREALLGSDPTEDPQYKDRKFDYAPATQVTGLMREMMLAGEFGKRAIPGYRVSDRYKGETVLNDGTMVAQIDRIYIGPNLWGYVIDATNLLDTSQKINPATFRLDGTRAVSANNWELAARPLNVEQQIAGKHAGKIYIVTRARRNA